MLLQEVKPTMREFDSRITQAKEAIENGDNNEAYTLLLEIIEKNERIEEVWWLLSGIVDDPQDVQICLENVLDLNPNNHEAQQRLQENRVVLLQNQTLAYLRQNEITDINPLKPIYDGLRRVLEEEVSVDDHKNHETIYNQIITELDMPNPLEALYLEKECEAIYVHGYTSVFIEKNNVWQKTHVRFDNENHLEQVIDSIVRHSTWITDKTAQHVDARLNDGSRVRIVRAPAAANSPILTVRKHNHIWSMSDLVESSFCPSEIAEFLRSCIIAGIKILIVGEAGTGKTTLTNVLSSFVPNDERIITVERIAELQLQQEHVVTLETNSPIQVESLLKHRPDRVVFGDIELKDVPHFIDTSLCIPTYAMMRARNADAALNQLEIGSLMALKQSTPTLVRRNIASAIDLVITLRKFEDGSRKVSEVVEIINPDNGNYENVPLFNFRVSGFENEKIIGRHVATGNVSSFLERIENAGIHVSPRIFGSSPQD